MKRFRKIIFWAHLVTGVTAGVIVLIMSVTGALLAYERQLTAWADGYHITPPATDAKSLPVETLLAKVQAASSNSVPAGITLRADSSAPATVSFGRDRTVFVNPYTGEILGEGATAWRKFFHLMTDWHRWLGTNEHGRAIGKGITGACNLAFLFLVVSGFYLWWPRNWSWSTLRPALWFVRGQRGKARDWNWHNVIGLWCAPVLFCIVLTGVVMSYPWANNLLFKLTGSEPPPQRQSAAKETGPAAGRDRESRPATEIQTDGLNDLWATAEKKVSGWNYISLRFPQKPGGPPTFLIDRGNGPRPDLRATLVLDADTGEEIRWQPYASQSAGQKARAWGRFIHTGEAGGFLGQTIAFLASAGAAMLVWTGLALAWRRFFQPN